MPFQYSNRKGDKYFLQAGKTRTGKPRYYFGRKITGEPLDTLPEGYEVRETPENALVTLRKKKPTEISSLEGQIVEEGVRRHAGLEHFIVDFDRDSLVVYLPDTGEQEAERTVKMLRVPWLSSSMHCRESSDWLMRQSHYSPMMRFELADADERLFCLQRWCFLGSIDRWIFLAGPAPLPDLVREYAPHLGKRSFFELM